MLTPALCLQVGYWFGRELPLSGPVLIGMDSRSSGSMVASALTAGLTAAGREVWSLGLCATPAVPLLIRQVGAAGGLMVSASHNPPKTTASRLSVRMAPSLAVIFSPVSKLVFAVKSRWVNPIRSTALRLIIVPIC